MGLICSKNLVTVGNLSTTASPLLLPISNAAGYGFRAPARNGIGESGGEWIWDVAVDLGSAKTPDLFAQLGTNLQGYNMLVYASGASVSDFSTLLYTASADITVDGYGHIFIPLIANTTACRYWRFRIKLYDTFPSFIDIGRTWLSDDGVREDFDFDWVPGKLFGTTIATSPRGRVQRTASGKPRRTLEVKLSNLSKSAAIGDYPSTLGTLDTVLASAGENGEIIVMPYPHLAIGQAQNMAVYGYLDDDRLLLPRQRGGFFNGSLRVTEIPA